MTSMKKINFRFREHPGDLLRGTLIKELPNPEKELDAFLLQFLPCYQTDDTVAFLDDLYKLYDDEFEDEGDMLNFVEYIGGSKTKKEIKMEINEVEDDLTMRAYKNFYQLILEDKIEILTNGEE